MKWTGLTEGLGLAAAIALGCVSSSPKATPARLAASAGGLPEAGADAAVARPACGKATSRNADTLEIRERASIPVTWTAPGGETKKDLVRLKLLGFNDFHGQLSTDKQVGGRKVGGAAILAGYLARASASAGDTTIIAHAGDFIGASPPASALNQDEPAIDFMNLLANQQCARDVMSARCNIVVTPGNHEFDEGTDELMRMIRGGQHANGPFLGTYRGARFPFVAANVLDAKTNRPILPPYVVKTVGTVRVGFIGADLKDTPMFVVASGIRTVRFIDEAAAVNESVRELRKAGVRAIVLLLHQGGYQSFAPDAPAAVKGPIAGIVASLDDVDVIVSGHTHSVLNALVPAKSGKPVLVAQAFSSGTAFDEIDLGLDAKTGEVVTKSSRIVSTWADDQAKATPESRTLALVERAEASVRARVERVVGQAKTTVLAAPDCAGESALGELVADAQRAAMKTDFAFVTPAWLRADLPAGDITWGALFAIQPFGNRLVRMQMKGREIVEALSHQWDDDSMSHQMHVSGLRYTWDPSRPPRERVVEVTKDGRPLDLDAAYTVTANEFLAEGGEKLSAFAEGKSREIGPLDIDVLTDYVKSVGHPIDAKVDGRIRQVP